MADPAFVVEGYLNLESQEGGYVGPDWQIDKSTLADLVARHFGIEHVAWEGWERNKYPYAPGDLPVGRVRITIERIDNDPASLPADDVERPSPPGKAPSSAARGAG